MNFQLWNYYGTAPVITERIELGGDGVNPTTSTGTELLDQAIEDLGEAATLLPGEWPATEVGRVTSHSANGMLTKALVFRGTVTNNQADYQAAITAAKLFRDGN